MAIAEWQMAFCGRLHYKGCGHLCSGVSAASWDCSREETCFLATVWKPAKAGGDFFLNKASDLWAHKSSGFFCLFFSPLICSASNAASLETTQQNFVIKTSAYAHKANSYLISIWLLNATCQLHVFHLTVSIEHLYGNIFLIITEQNWYGTFISTSVPCSLWRLWCK